MVRPTSVFLRASIGALNLIAVTGTNDAHRHGAPEVNSLGLLPDDFDDPEDDNFERTPNEKADRRKRGKTVESFFEVDEPENKHISDDESTAENISRTPNPGGTDQPLAEVRERAWSWPGYQEESDVENESAFLQFSKEAEEEEETPDTADNEGLNLHPDKEGEDEEEKTPDTDNEGANLHPDLDKDELIANGAYGGGWRQLNANAPEFQPTQLFTPNGPPFPTQFPDSFNVFDHPNELIIAPELGLMQWAQQQKDYRHMQEVHDQGGEIVSELFFQPQFVLQQQLIEQPHANQQQEQPHFVLQQQLIEQALVNQQQEPQFDLAAQQQLIEQALVNQQQQGYHYAEPRVNLESRWTAEQILEFFDHPEFRNYLILESGDPAEVADMIAKLRHLSQNVEQQLNNLLHNQGELQTFDELDGNLQSIRQNHSLIHSLVQNSRINTISPWVDQKLVEPVLLALKRKIQDARLQGLSQQELVDQLDQAMRKPTYYETIRKHAAAWGPGRLLPHQIRSAREKIETMRVALIKLQSPLQVSQQEMSRDHLEEIEKYIIKSSDKDFKELMADLDPLAITIMSSKTYNFISGYIFYRANLLPTSHERFQAIEGYLRGLAELFSAGVPEFMNAFTKSMNEYIKKSGERSYNPADYIIRTLQTLIWIVGENENPEYAKIFEPFLPQNSDAMWRANIMAFAQHPVGQHVLEAMYLFARNDIQGKSWRSFVQALKEDVIRNPEDWLDVSNHKAQLSRIPEGLVDASIRTLTEDEKQRIHQSYKQLGRKEHNKLRNLIRLKLSLFDADMEEYAHVYFSKNPEEESAFIKDFPDVRTKMQSLSMKQLLKDYIQAETSNFGSGDRKGGRKGNGKGISNNQQSLLSGHTTPYRQVVHSQTRDCEKNGNCEKKPTVDYTALNPPRHNESDASTSDGGSQSQSPTDQRRASAQSFLSIGGRHSSPLIERNTYRY